MNWLSASPGVVLTAYHPSGNNAVAGSNAKESEETVPSSRRSGQYTMNHDNSKKSTERPQMDRSSSQDSLDELSMDDYWKELENIHETSKNNHREQEVVVVKEPDEGELEEEWLKEAGLSNLFGESTGDSLDSMVFLSTLTRTQTAAVQKRVETVSQTLRKKNKPYQVPDVRDIFRQQSDSKEKVSGESEPSSVTARETKNEAQDEVKDDPEFNLGISEKTTLLEDVPVSETDINLEISFAEQAANLKDSSIGKMCKDKEDDTLLPNFRLPKDKTGTTKIGDLAPQDMKKVYSLALIELTALYDLLGTEFKQQKAIKIKTKDSGLFGVPLSVLLEQDQKKVPGTRIPLIFHKLISQIEEARLDTEGLLRIPGVAARVKSLCQELEAKFYEGTFNWESVKQHDAASLLKLFIRELPQPLLTVEYLKAFQDVQNLPTKKHQLQALNLLVLLLPEANRDTLKILLEFLQRIPKFIVNQVRKQNTASQKKEKKDKAMKKLLKKMAYDKEKHEKQDKSPNDADVPQGVIRVQAPHLSKVSMAIQLTEELKASDIVARFLSQKSGVVQALKKEEVFLYEIGGNIGERCLDDDTYMKDLYQLNPNAEWVIKCKHS
ncbi:rho GTPase-activating protein 18 isoform X2 [Terrapene carolina triunguis]|uniref:rho GTPase-activating protein 18 isoform X2 n=1 Tax=Terrapene triunguis TaxID=2587831 RepID=UPI000E77861A|nr:rho GTPase-activating protein 18 isoform X2 [Terrapene carolina triunguis]